MNTRQIKENAAAYMVVTKWQEDAGMLYKTYFHHILRIVKKYFSCYDTSRDMAMDVFMKILFNLDKYKEMGHGMVPWISRITYNEVMQAFRRQKAEIKKSSLDISEFYALKEEEEPKEDFIEEILTTEWPIIKNILLNMDENSYALIYLRFFKRMPYKKIAEHLGITENNTKVRLTRLLKRIRKEYEYYKMREERKRKRIKVQACPIGPPK